MTIIDASRSMEDCEAEVLSLKRKLETLPIIEQAKGILMGAQGCTEDEAFDLLRRASQRENRKLRDIAAGVVHNVQRRAAAKQGNGACDGDGLLSAP